jgi:hypothetical protein
MPLDLLDLIDFVATEKNANTSDTIRRLLRSHPEIEFRRKQLGIELQELVGPGRPRKIAVTPPRAAVSPPARNKRAKAEK